MVESLYHFHEIDHHFVVVIIPRLAANMHAEINSSKLFVVVSSKCSLKSLIQDESRFVLTIISGREDFLNC